MSTDTNMNTKMSGVVATVVCAICKRPLIRTSDQFWVCTNPDRAHRGLIPAGTVNSVALVNGRTRTTPIEV